MRAAFSTDMLLRLMNATPEQYAAVERVLGMAADNGLEAVEPEPSNDAVALKLFALIRALESKSNYRKAPVTRVFQLYCLESLTQRQVAKACRCSLALVKMRLSVLEKKLGRKPSQLRTLSSEFERITDSLSDPRARRIHRQRAIEGNDREDDGQF
jgi:hypothetical protein